MAEDSMDAGSATDGGISSSGGAAVSAGGDVGGSSSSPDSSSSSSGGESRHASRRQAIADAISNSRGEKPAQKQISTDRPGDRGTEADVKPIQRPKSWSKEASSSWDSLPRDVQEIVAKRESERDRDYTSKTEAIAKERAAWERQRGLAQLFQQAAQPHLQRWHLGGVNPQTRINEMLALDALAAKDPRAAIRELSKKWRVDLGGFTQQQQQRQQNGQAQPQGGAIPGLRDALAPLIQEVAQLKKAATFEKQNRARARQLATTREVELFKSAVGDDGAPMRPHFDTVKQTMATLADQIERANPTKPTKEILAEAYEQAIWAHPEVRKQLLEAQQKSREDQVRVEAAKRVTEAKKAATPIVGSPNGRTAATGLSRRDQILAAMREHGH